MKQKMRTETCLFTPITSRLQLFATSSLSRVAHITLCTSDDPMLSQEAIAPSDPSSGRVTMANGNAHKLYNMLMDSEKTCVKMPSCSWAEIGRLIMHRSVHLDDDDRSIESWLVRSLFLLWTLCINLFVRGRFCALCICLRDATQQQQQQHLPGPLHCQPDKFVNCGWPVSRWAIEYQLLFNLWLTQ